MKILYHHAISLNVQMIDSLGEFVIKMKSVVEKEQNVIDDWGNASSIQRSRWWDKKDLFNDFNVKQLVESCGF